MGDGPSAPPPGAYRLDELGWFQFERLASLTLEAEAGLHGLRWDGHAYGVRLARVEEAVLLAGPGVRLPGPVVVAAAWIGDRARYADRLAELVDHVLGVAGEPGLRSADEVLLLTNLDARAAAEALRAESAALRERVVVLGAAELGQSLDRNAPLRSAMPSVLGLRDLGPLIDRRVRMRSSLEVERAQALARVFVPTRAYEQARAVLARHRFVVLTGPPEMGKTAIAQMIALAQLTDGWEAHDCTDPEQVWRAFDRDRPQVFLADDAFGSTEYRPDAAERWARELGRMLAMLDQRHWLIWTSRPAPLKAGLRRVQREHGSERFPAPGEVLLDAGNLDLAEKTLILFRHVKDHTAADGARELVRAAGLKIVEHQHFTPERIRRFVTDRLDDLVGRREQLGESAVLRAVQDELASPTQAMENSFRALEGQHRALLIALLDTPAGLTDERELAAALRRHHPAGLSRPPSELIDRLSDHFLRASPLGIDWVHPSWRDLVIEQLRSERDARRAFLRACGPYGAIFVLSVAGGATGRRILPLLVEDGDWDTFTDRVSELVGEFEEQELARLLLACSGMLEADLDASLWAEARSLGEYVLGATRRAWDHRGRPLPVFLLDAWYELNSRLPEPLAAPRLGPTWAELHPASLAFAGERSELRRLDEWLALCQTLVGHDRQALRALGFPREEVPTLQRVGRALARLADTPDGDLRSTAEELISRLRRVAPGYGLGEELEGLPRIASSEDRWWVPEDLDRPPTTDRVAPAPAAFTREDVDRVLSDL